MRYIKSYTYIVKLKVLQIKKGGITMRVLSNEERVKILSDIVSIKL